MKKIFFSYFEAIPICLFAFFVSVFLTWLTRIYAIRKAILDIPNERSSHSIPTPRGGGIAIVFTLVSFLIFLFQQGYLETNLVMALTGGGIIIAVIGYIDDVYSVKSSVRLLIHFLAACWAVYCLHGFTVLDIGTLKINLNAMGNLLAIIGIIWCINLYNFMDGIDGIAGSEGVFIGISSALILCIIHQFSVAFLMGLLSSIIAGFLIWNWPPAKIFLGDVGSGFLGYTFAVVSLYTINKDFLPLTYWLITWSIFLIDTTFTLFYRMVKGKKWYSAHREHAYQQLILFGASHAQVTFGIIIINLFFLPLAFATVFWPARSLPLLTIIFLTLVLICAGIKVRFYSIQNN